MECCTMDKIRVSIVEDDIAWLKAMTGFLNTNDDMVITGTASSKEDAVNMARTIQCDVILMDINLNENTCDGIYAAYEILQFSQVKIIMLTSLKDEEIIKDAFTAGAINYVSKENYKDIPSAIRNAVKDNSPFEVILKEFSRLKKEEQLKDLTEAEKEVYRYIEKGYTQPQITQTLYKTHNTLRAQIKSILKKLGVSSSKEAIKKVNSKGLLSKDKPLEQNKIDE